MSKQSKSASSLLTRYIILFGILLFLALLAASLNHIRPRSAGGKHKDKFEISNTDSAVVSGKVNVLPSSSSPTNDFNNDDNNDDIGSKNITNTTIAARRRRLRRNIFNHQQQKNKYAGQQYAEYDDSKPEALLLFPRADLWERSWLINELLANYSVTVIEHEARDARRPPKPFLNPQEERYLLDAIADEQQAKARLRQQKLLSKMGNNSFSSSSFSSSCSFPLRIAVFQALQQVSIGAIRNVLEVGRPSICIAVSDEGGRGVRQVGAMEAYRGCKIIMKQYAHRDTDARRYKIVPLGYYNGAFPRGFEPRIRRPSSSTTKSASQQQQQQTSSQLLQQPKLAQILDNISNSGLGWADRVQLRQIYKSLDDQLMGKGGGEERGRKNQSVVVVTTLIPEEEKEKKWGALIPASERYYNFAFLGGLKKDRKDMLDRWSEWAPNFVRAHHGGHGPEVPVGPATVSRMYMHAKFAPCGRGFIALEQFRLHEASLAGSIPVIAFGPGNEREVRIRFESYVGHVGERPPWVFAQDWGEAIWRARELAENATALDEQQRRVVQFYRTSIAAARQAVEQVRVDVNAKGLC